MKLIIKKEKSFTIKDQDNFSKISGDFNLMHLEEEYARRTIANGIAIHGINLVFWSLNEFFKLKKKPAIIKKINIDFLTFASLNKKIITQIYYKQNKLIIDINDKNNSIALIKLSFINNKKIIKNYKTNIFKISKPKNEALNLDKIKDRAFKEKNIFNYFVLKKNYNYLCKYLNLNQIGDLATISRFVGMKVPGYNSILNKISLNFTNNKNETKININSFDERFNLIKLLFNGTNLKGDVFTFTRPDVSVKVNYELNKQIKKRQFKNQKALIVGGSRGLGEATLQLLAYGGAKIFFTYNRGSKDSNYLKKNLFKINKNIKVAKLDINKKLSNKVINMIKKFSPSHFYYFATPKIFDGQSFKFNQQKFAEFNEYYLYGFYKIFQILDKKKLKIVFSPSSVSLKEITSKLCDYSCSKAAQETLFKYLQSEFKDIKFFSTRLPRLKTDQTQTIFQQKTKLPYPYMLKLIKKFSKI